MSTHSTSQFRRSMICAAIGAMLLPACGLATPLSLSTAPASASYKVPAPNVIVSVDDSGSMGSTGMAALRSALQMTFTPSNVPDGSIRMAWQAMTNCYTIPSPSCSNLNVMKVLDSTHRANFMNWVATLGPIGSTPSHRMLRNAGEYLRTPVDVNSAWASVPGVTLDPVLSCRRSYNLFMTDGGWNTLTLPIDNAIGDADNTARMLPDGTVYDIVGSDTTIYRDGAKGNWSGTTLTTTLSDMAFYYWATDLQPGMPNTVKPLIKSPGATTYKDGKTATIPQYWKPQNDPATWQHMTMYTVGFNGAANWSVKPKFGSDTWTGGDYDKLITGKDQWPNPITGAEDKERITELWHMALNTRGKFIPAPDPAALATAFQDIINEIIVDNSRPSTSLSVSSTSLRRNSAMYVAGYDAASWTGQVTAYGVAAGTGTVSNTGLWGTVPASGGLPPRPKSTADVLDDASFAPNARVVLSAQSPVLGAPPVGISWDWASLTAVKRAEISMLNGVPDKRGKDRVAYIRGDRSEEGVAQPAATPPTLQDPTFRTRASRQGDIVNSEVWFTPGIPDAPYRIKNYATFRSANAARSPMLYVGGNDGMLHGFDPADGSEKIAYIPDGVHARLPLLTRQPYAHQYFVDGSPFTADVHDGTAWKTYLAGFPGLGGRGYFVLDVTDPSAFKPSNASSIVVLDQTASLDADIGHVTSQPVLDQTNPKLAIQLTRMNNGRWALVTGNGANSLSEKAVLLVQYVDGAKELVKIGTDNLGGNGNGLSAPRLVDINGDHIPDIAYAGDLRGNLWKFDLSHPSATNWTVAFGGTPLYVATDSGGARQPITTAPGWLFHPNGGLMVSVGTGRNLVDADRVSSLQQTLYGVYDSTAITINSTVNALTGSGTVTLAPTNNAVTGARTFLVQQTVSGTSTAVSEVGNTMWTLSSNPVPYTGAGAKKGWYIDLPATRERADRSMHWVSGQLFAIPSNSPAVGGDPNEETCTPSTVVGESYLSVVNIINGSAPKYSVFSYSVVAGVATTVLPGGVTPPSRVAINGIYAYQDDITDPASKRCTAPPGSPACDSLAAIPSLMLRPTWRQAQ